MISAAAAALAVLRRVDLAGALAASALGASLAVVLLVVLVVVLVFAVAARGCFLVSVVLLALVAGFLPVVLLVVLLAGFLLEEVSAFLAPGATEVPSAVVERSEDRREESPPRRREVLSDMNPTIAIRPSPFKHSSSSACRFLISVRCRIRRCGWSGGVEPHDDP